ncbi:hypothetical protein BGZ54_001511, partial [Gamsiella multidivaricata]
TMIERSPTSPGPVVMGRRFSTLGHVQEEEQEHEHEHGEGAEKDGRGHHHHQHHQHHHSYHIDARKSATLVLGHSKSYSAHDYLQQHSTGGGGRDLGSAGYRAKKRYSVDFSVLSDPTSAEQDDNDDDDDGDENEEEEEGMWMDEDRGAQSSEGYAHNRRMLGPATGPSASYLTMRRGSVRELMAIDHLCLSSEEVERC